MSTCLLLNIQFRHDLAAAVQHHAMACHALQALVWCTRRSARRPAPPPSSCRPSSAMNPLPLCAGQPHSRLYDEFALADRLRMRGWVLPGACDCRWWRQRRARHKAGWPRQRGGLAAGRATCIKQTANATAAITPVLRSLQGAQGCRGSEDDVRDVLWGMVAQKMLCVNGGAQGTPALLRACPRLGCWDTQWGAAASIPPRPAFICH